MISENYIQLRAYIERFRYYPAQPNPGNSEPDLTRPRNPRSMLLLTVRSRGPFSPKFNQYFECVCYGRFADLVHGSFKEGDQIIVQGEPFVRIHKRAQPNAVRFYQIFVHRIFPCLATGGWTRILKMDLDGRFTVDTICDEEVLGI